MIAEYKNDIVYRHGEVPTRDGMKPGDIWIIVDGDGTVVAVDFLCPCGCGRPYYTPVTDATKGQPKESDRWLFSRGPNGVTVFPSIRCLSGCKSHFNITDGKTVMHGDSGQ